MGTRRTIASLVAVALLVTVLGACGSSSKSSATAKARTAAQAKAARAKIAAAKRRLAAARARVAAQRRALAAEVRREHLRARARAAAAKRAATSTTSTTVPGVATPTTAPVAVKPGPSPPKSAVTIVAADAAAIQQAIDTVNAAFAKGVAAGIAASEFANYYVGAGIYSDGECSAFEAGRGLGIVADRLVVHPGSIVATPGWVDPLLRGVPKGRVYALTMTDVQTQIVTKQTRSQVVTTHATVGVKGRAQLFFRCR